MAKFSIRNESKYTMPADVASVVGVVDTHLRWKNKNNQRERSYVSWHPSEFGHCLRKMQYMRYAEDGLIKPDSPQELTSQQLRLFEKGHNMQARWTRYFDAIGILKGVWKCENLCCRMWDDNGKFIGAEGNIIPFEKPRIYGLDEKVGVFKPDKCYCGCTKFAYDEVEVKDKEMNMYGHADLILDFSRFDPNRYDNVIKNFNTNELPKGPVVADMKTIKDSRYDDLMSSCTPDLGYQVQLTIYANVLGCEYGLLFYENKDNSKLAAFKINKNTDTWFPKIKEQSIIMRDMITKKLLPPPRPLSQSDYDCKYCPFQKRCHASKAWQDTNLNNIRKEFYGILL